LNEKEIGGGKRDEIFFKLPDEEIKIIMIIHS